MSVNHRQLQILQEKLTEFFLANPEEFVNFLSSGKSIKEYLTDEGQKLIKFLLPETFLVTIELASPKGSTISDTIMMLGNNLPCATVVHIEKKEVIG